MIECGWFAAMPLPSNTHLGRYEIRSLLGEGGMGEVYLAEDTTLRRLVAVKLLPAEFTADRDRLRRFEREAFAASSLNHPNIPPLSRSNAPTESTISRCNSLKSTRTTTPCAPKRASKTSCAASGCRSKQFQA